ncbi:MAG: hypothetical protein ACXWDM_01685 [Nocardioides sp.]
MTLLVALLALLLSTGPATAAKERFTDANDRRGFDVRVVKVNYGARLNIRLVHDGKIAVGQQYRYWIDTKPKNVGPEYVFAFEPNSDSAGLQRVNGFSDTGTAVRGCRQLWGGSADIFQPRRDVLAMVGPRCLDRPTRVRVSVQVKVSGRDDWAPDFHKFSARVSRH